MHALRRVTEWPVENVTAAVVRPGRELRQRSATSIHPYRLASISKPLAAWAALVAVEEGIVTLDESPRNIEVQDGCTLRHLLSHAGGYPFDGAVPIAPAWTTPDLLEHRFRARRVRGRRGSGHAVRAVRA